MKTRLGRTCVSGRRLRGILLPTLVLATFETAPCLASAVPITQAETSLLTASDPSHTPVELRELSLDPPPVVTHSATAVSLIGASPIETQDQTAVPLPTPLWSGLTGLVGMAVVGSFAGRRFQRG